MIYKSSQKYIISFASATQINKQNPPKGRMLIILWKKMENFGIKWKNIHKFATLFKV
jgi:hypothetical protein